MSNRIEIVLLGRLVGTASGWDGEEQAFTFYDVETNAPIPLGNSKELCCDLEWGVFQVFDDQGNVLTEVDMIPILSTLPLKSSE